MEEYEKIENGFMTNQQYRDEINKLFERVNENYKLRWFYKFIVKKLEDSI